MFLDEALHENFNILGFVPAYIVNSWPCWSVQHIWKKRIASNRDEWKPILLGPCTSNFWPFRPLHEFGHPMNYDVTDVPSRRSPFCRTCSDPSSILRWNPTNELWKIDVIMMIPTGHPTHQKKKKKDTFPKKNTTDATILEINGVTIPWEWW